MVPHFKNYLNYSQSNSNSKLGLKLETLSIGAESPSLKGSMNGVKMGDHSYTWLRIQ